MTVAAPHRITPEEYLALERAAEYKSEYFNGEIFSMAGASPAHNRIAHSISGQFYLQLRGGPCETSQSDQRLKVSQTGLYTYPDLLVVCGESQYDDRMTDTLLNPTLILEILSPSTESYDRGDKFAHYRSIKTLKEYVLVAQNKPRIERFVRGPNETWIYHESSELDAVVEFASIPARLALAEVYEDVGFPPALTLRSATEQ